MAQQQKKVATVVKTAQAENIETPRSTRYPLAVKRMIAHQIEREMVAQSLSRARLATLMGTSRAAINRLLDPDNRSVTLQTLERISEILGKRLQVFLSD